MSDAKLSVRVDVPQCFAPGKPTQEEGTHNGSTTLEYLQQVMNFGISLC